jgi:Glycosyl transferase family 2
MDPPEFSVIIGRVSTVDSDVLFDVLQALSAQLHVPAPEVILADRTGGSGLDRISREFPDVRLLHCESGTSLPRLRSIALQSSAGRIIVVTEDHCIPASDWLYQIARAFERAPNASMVTGPVKNGATSTTLDWATYLFEYASVTAPTMEGWVHTAAGMNVAYRRSFLDALSRDALERGFWEHTIHGELVSGAQRIFASQSVVVEHRKRIPLASFLSQRFLYSRYFAGSRFPRRAVFKRAIAALSTPLLIPLLLARLMSEVRRRPQLRKPALRGSLMLFVFALTAATGELVGYVNGGKDAMNRLE